ncbi:MAG: plasmid pRiA4b ORF-3 family protein [Schlesneria sp.]
MARKPKSPQIDGESSLPSIASMKFWDRFKQPPPMLAFAFPESADDEPQSLDRLMRLPNVPCDDSLAYCLRISLDDSKPSIWRRILVKSLNLQVLHQVVQVAMGWEDMHLHGFDIRKIRVPLAGDGASIDERSISIAQLFAAKIKTFTYTYDFGDSWKHTISIEKTLAAESFASYPRCLDGKGGCPIEDIGGIDRWTRLLKLVEDAEEKIFSEPDLDEALSRYGCDFVPPLFDIDEINVRLEREIR